MVNSAPLENAIKDVMTTALVFVNMAREDNDLRSILLNYPEFIVLANAVDRTKLTSNDYIAALTR